MDDRAKQVEFLCSECSDSPVTGSPPSAIWLVQRACARLDAGRIVFEGTPTDLVAARSTLTGGHLAACVGT